MTAEIAILNKTAVALASDSAVTISAGSNQEKIYDSADKLFELSEHDPIGIMINNDMSFMEVPLPVLVKKYRSKGKKFAKIEDAALDFLTYLHEFGKSAPQAVKLKHLSRQITPIVDRIQERSHAALMRFFDEPDESVAGRPIAEIMAEYLSRAIAVVRTALERSPTAKFLGDGAIELSEAEKSEVTKIVEANLSAASAEQRAEVCQIVIDNIGKIGWTSSTTGVVVAGFGADELFPTLVSFELYGTVAGRLKYLRTNHVDIDRDGERARVLPFAQREMVERFLYGLDDEIERKIKQFCERAVPDIAKKLVESLEMSEDDQKALKSQALVAERAFYDGLAEKSFAAIRKQSETEIEDMVEFMPKPEMARMAEALVNLTSIKRRVSRGMETVGGPIDVAIISQAEGFVWVKRKHYFPAELNQRYFDRKQHGTGQSQEVDNGQPKL
jgi:hypothetical protein